MKAAVLQKRLLAVVPWACFAICCFAIGFQFYKNYTFVPTNGDYQNYNAIRRIWAGQAPFRDFTAYLGAGVSWLSWLVTLPLGNTLMDSKIATHALTFAMCCLSVWMLVRCETGSPRIARWALALCTGLLTMSALFWGGLPVLKELGISDYFLVSNSLRQVRALLPVLLCMPLFLLCRLPEPKTKRRMRPYALPVVLGCLAGFARVWCNDGGMAAMLAMLAAFFLMRVRLKKQFWLELLVLLACTALFEALWAFVLTGGGLVEWFQYNSMFGSCAGEQRWRFLSGPEKAYSIDDILRLLASQTLSFWLLLGYGFFASLRARRHARFRKQAGEYCAAVLAFSLILCRLINQLSSVTVSLGGQPLIDFAVLILAVIWLFKLAGWLLRRRGGTPAWLPRAGVCAAALIVLVSTGSACAKSLDTYRTAGYNGYLYAHASSYPSEGGMFSTYATAAEDRAQVFQPTGTDYIIHVMGKDMQDEYLRIFHETAPAHVYTQNPASNLWELWAMRSYWYFYRELLADYEPTESLNWDYLYAWQPCAASRAVAVPQEETSFAFDGCALTVQTVPGEPRVMDVRIVYSVLPVSASAKWRYFGSQVDISDAWSTYIPAAAASADMQAVPTHALPGGESQSAYIPVYIDEAGHGSVTFTQYPQELTVFTLEQTEGISLLPLPEAYRP